MGRQARLRAEEKRLARRLATAYLDGKRQPTDVADAHAERAEQQLPWKRDFQRACYIQDVAIRYAFLKEARRG